MEKTTTPVKNRILEIKNIARGWITKLGGFTEDEYCKHYGIE